MLKRAGKRLLILLPALWLLVSVVFLISKSIPGSAAENLFDQADQNPNSLAKAEIYQRAYRQHLHRTGQDLPLFYFSVATAAEPDTLFKIFPETYRAALKKLTLTYGNWPEISNFYRNLQEFKRTLQTAEINSFLKTKISNEADKLLQFNHPEELTNGIVLLKKNTGTTNNAAIQKSFAKVDKSYRRIISKQKPQNNYYPALHWHGINNQYHRWFSHLIKGDLGISSRDSRPVSEVIAEAFEVTIILAAATFIITGLLSPEIAMFLSRKSKIKWRSPVLGFLYSLESIPLFIVALGILSVAGFAGWLADFPEEMAMVLAVLCLTLVNLPYLTGQAYSAFQNVLQQPYILAARAKGVSETRLLRRHVFRNSLFPLITLLADFLPGLLAGTVALEVIFAIPGMGRLLVGSVLARDYEVLTGLVLFAGLFKMLAHLLADWLYLLADPRLSRQ